MPCAIGEPLTPSEFLTPDVHRRRAAHVGAFTAALGPGRDPSRAIPCQSAFRRVSPSRRRLMRTFPLSLAAIVVFAACSEAPTTPATESPSPALGNGFPQGGHDYRLNIIGVPHDKTAT